MDLANYEIDWTLFHHDEGEILNHPEPGQPDRKS